MGKVAAPSSMDTFCWCPTRSRLLSSPVSWFLRCVLWQELIKICWQGRRGNAPESFFVIPASDVGKKLFATCSIWIFLKWGLLVERSWKLKNQRKKPKQTHLCSHHCFSLLLLVVCSNWRDSVFRSWRSVCILRLVWLKLLQFFSQGLSGHVYLLEKTTLARPLPSFHGSILTLHWAQHPIIWSKGFFVSFLPQIHVPRAWRWLSMKVFTPFHLKESHMGFPDKYHQGWRKSSKFSPLPAELTQNKNVMCFIAGGRAN